MNQNREQEETKPPSSIFHRLIKFIKNPFFIRTKSVSEVSDFLKDAVDLNIIDKEAESIANKAIKLGDTTVKEIMVPKVEMVTVSEDEEKDEILSRIIESGHSRYPVLGEQRDEVTGILLAKDILPKIVNNEQEFSINDVLRDPKTVPESKKADSLLEEFKKDKSHLAVVIDEYGSICGLVTIEDILEELVGEIEDEHDTSHHEIKEISSNKFIADAKLELEIFINYFNLDIDPDLVDAETLGGFIITKLGILPKINDELNIEDIKIIVKEADERKVDKVLIIKD